MPWRAEQKETFFVFQIPFFILNEMEIVDLVFCKQLSSVRCFMERKLLPPLTQVTVRNRAKAQHSLLQRLVTKQVFAQSADSNTDMNSGKYYSANAILSSHDSVSSNLTFITALNNATKKFSWFTYRFCGFLNNLACF